MPSSISAHISARVGQATQPDVSSVSEVLQQDSLVGAPTPCNAEVYEATEVYTSDSEAELVPVRSAGGKPSLSAPLPHQLHLDTPADTTTWGDTPQYVHASCTGVEYMPCPQFIGNGFALPSCMLPALPAAQLLWAGPAVPPPLPSALNAFLGVP